MNIIEIISNELKVKSKQVENAVKLIDEGNTIPFIARYRKEATGGLSDEQLRNLDDRLSYLRNLEKRKEEVIKSIEEQGKMNEKIKNEIEMCITLSEVEDIYRPYKQKKRTRATIAKENGLEELANIIMKQDPKIDINNFAKKFVNKEKNIENIEDAINGALDIIAEDISDNAYYRKKIKKICYDEGKIFTKAVNKEEKTAVDMYYDFNENIKEIPAHRILAINRGEKESIIKVKIDKPEINIIAFLEKNIIKNKDNEYAGYLKRCIKDSFTRLIEPSIDREIRSELTERADEQAIKVFGKNAKQLLLASPVKGKNVIGFDPAYRTGCKIAVIDETGKVMDTTTVYPTEPQNDIEGAKKELINLVIKDDADIFAIGNGTASRESEEFVASLIKEIKEKYGKNLAYVIVSEAGASVYSASKLATEEYPDINVSLRGAISIARRLQDPLAELVKIDPKSIGVGQYQHDVNQKKLEESLRGVVEDAVNSVGVDVNTATPSLLSYVAGINKTVAKNIVNYREENGKIMERKELLKVPKLGKAAYEQCAGFLRIPEGSNPLEITGVHPECYEIAEKILNEIGFKINDLTNKNKLKEIKLKLLEINNEKYIKENLLKFNVGEFTIKDIINEMIKPGRDPREEMQKPILRADVLSFKDLAEGMVLNGTVRNVTDFGAFVDIGIKHDGLVHISEMSEKFVKSPYDIVSVGDIISVKVIGIDKDKQQVKLSMKIKN